MVKVHLASHLGRTLGVREAEVQADSVRGVLHELSGRFGHAFDEAARSCKVIVNGTNVAFLQGEATKVADGDDVTLLPPLAGG
jgi:molybdopterin converting factor small subunit